LRRISGNRFTYRMNPKKIFTEEASSGKLSVKQWIMTQSTENPNSAE
jgi:hypothetical protein